MSGFSEMARAAAQKQLVDLLGDNVEGKLDRVALSALLNKITEPVLQRAESLDLAWFRIEDEMRQRNYDPNGSHWANAYKRFEMRAKITLDYAAAAAAASEKMLLQL